MIKINKYTKKDVTEFLTESNAIENVYGSQSLTESKQAWDYITKQKKITLTNILEMHRLNGQRLHRDIAGKWRDCDVWIGGVRKYFISESLIKEDIKNWIKMCEQNISKLPDLLKEEIINQWHVKFEFIHPFTDQNGRCGRLLLNWQRLKNGLPILIIHEGEEQYQYYSWFKQ